MDSKHTITTGGGILVSTILIFSIPLNLNAVELSTLCTNPNSECKINTPQTTITNHSHFTTGGSEGIYIYTTIGTFTNYGDISVGNGNQAFKFESAGYIEHFFNYGNIAQNNKMSFYGGGSGISNLTNYGTMGGIEYSGSETMTINNFGLITHFKFTTEQERNLKTRNGGKIVIQNYALTISENATTFNGYKNGGNLSHLLIYGDVSFADSSAKMILDFGSGFELGKPYKLDKLIVDSQNGSNKLKVDFGQLTTRSDLFDLAQSGENFIVNPVKDAKYSAIGSLHKSNIRTMNNFYTMSNSMIYPHKKVNANRAVKKKRVIRRVKKTANLFNESSLQSDSNAYLSSLRVLAKRQGEAIHESLESHESFAYKNNPSDSTNRRRISSNQTTNRQTSQVIPSTQNNDYYFILTPFINHNLFFESGRYNLSGFDYGFLTAFSGKLTANNSLGAHFMMSYGTLGDSSDKNFHISNLNLNLGVNYKLDLVWDSYLKARGDFFYFLNQVKTLTMRDAIKPNNLGFGLSVAYGKDFDFKQGGVLGIEGGIDYKALSANEITLDSMNETYKKSLYHLLYVDLGISYAKYFGGFGFNANLGIKGNVTANKLAKSKISLKNFNRSVDMILDNDKILGYANVGLSYVLNARNFDMEFSLAYYGNFGDRIISNGGGFEWRVGF